MPQDELTLRVMRALEESPNTSQRELATRLGVSLGGVNYCLKALIDMVGLKPVTLPVTKINELTPIF